MNLTKKVLSGIAALGTAFTIGNFDVHADSIPEYLSHQDVPIQLTEELGFNVENNNIRVTPTYFEEGVVQLSNLAGKGFVEESWIYLPKKKLWVEIGGSGESRSEVSHRGSLVYKMIAKEDFIKFFHIHLTPGLAHAFPSEVDLSTHSRLASEFYKTHSKGDVSFSVVNPNFYTEYRFDRDELRNFLDEQEVKGKNLDEAYKPLLTSFRKNDSNIGDIMHYFKQEGIDLSYFRIR